MRRNDPIKAVREIRNLLADGRRNYLAMAHRVNDEKARTLLKEIGNGHDLLEHELERSTGGLGGTNKATKATVYGTMERIWLTVRDVVNNTDELTVLADCEYQERNLMNRYVELLGSMSLDERIRAILMRQYGELEENVLRVRSIRAGMENLA
ncbi:MAG: PA2169 family four-helix-bundle protein [Flavobacteriales bacterium]|nr:PA2169 family four-helix-bundle protein [Flavobacteriales bacterium]MEB2341718.1 PA2169 family four-helix-bundle protein [Flavobacteriia bacterium]